MQYFFPIVMPIRSSKSLIFVTALPSLAKRNGSKFKDGVSLFCIRFVSHLYFTICMLCTFCILQRLPGGFSATNPAKNRRVFCRQIFSCRLSMPVSLAARNYICHALQRLSRGDSP